MSMWHHSKKWRMKLPGQSDLSDSITFRGEAKQDIDRKAIESRYLAEADRMLADSLYGKKVKKLLERMQE